MRTIPSLDALDVFGWVSSTVGAVLFMASLTRVFRANPDTRIPFVRSPPIIPPGSVAMRSSGAGFLVVGSFALSQTLGTWSFVIVLGLVLVPAVLIMIRNRRIPSQANR
ncbi:hypothetical protein [Mycetocola zhadangensis]|uniref:Uncharacterized protein n=1 Tax=Mycetocola zhadangensis TaxID=1164595 RepID=A0A3L7J636_9MICO|nr:hypothetical protein [Mycetocola zhadangensis]RLQ85929.1 hypothetical protein D9V28_03540 [Mycetocola zhadangensis]GGE87025.1 hypothetical protein GCM10011313_06940 [Mycetocola zhadangensis]